MTYLEFMNMLSAQKGKTILIHTDNAIYETKFTIRDLDGDDESYQYVTADLCFTEFKLCGMKVKVD